MIQLRRIGISTIRYSMEEAFRLHREGDELVMDLVERSVYKPTKPFKCGAIMTELQQDADLQSKPKRVYIGDDHFYVVPPDKSVIFYSRGENGTCTLPSLLCIQPALF